MLVGRFLLMIPVLAIAGSLGRKQPVPPRLAPSRPAPRCSPACSWGRGHRGRPDLLPRRRARPRRRAPRRQVLRSRSRLTPPSSPGRHRRRAAHPQVGRPNRRSRRCSTRPSCAGPSATRSASSTPGSWPATRSCSSSRSAASSPRCCSCATCAPRPPPTTSSPGSSPRGCGSRCCSRTSPKRWPKAGARRRPTRCARPVPRPSPSSADPTARSGRRRRAELQVGDRCVVGPGQVIPGDGEIVEGHRLGRRVGHHRRVGAGHPGVGRRPQLGHRRHPGALRPHRRADHARSRARASSTG